MALRYFLEILETGSGPIRSGIIPARRRGERVYDLVVLLHLRNKDGSPDRRRGMPFELANARLSKNAVHLRWNDSYHGSVGEVVLRKDGKDPTAVLGEITRRLNDLSKKKVYGMEETRSFLEGLRGTVLAHEIMTS